MTCLTLIQDAAIDLGLAPPAAAVGSTDATARKLLRLANKEGDELLKRHDWQVLTTERTFTSLATVEQTGFIPDDYSRLIYNAEIWDRTRNLKFAGPTPSRVWQELQSGLSGGIVGWWRLLGGEINVFPAQDAGNTLAFEYISKNWAVSSGGTARAKFEEDTDDTLLDEQLMVLGIVWRFGASTKGFDYSEALADYERALEKVASRDRGTGVIYPPPAESTIPPLPTWSGTITVP
jgi:hypothetical protein